MQTILTIYQMTLLFSHSLCLQDSIGKLQVGMQFDALLVDCTIAATFDIYPSDSPMDHLEKFATVGDDRNLVGVWVKARRVR